MTSTPKSSDFLQTLTQIVGASHVLTGSDLEPLLHDWRGRYHGAALAAVRPSNTEELAQVVRASVAAGIAMVPQGGNTSLCGGATPDASGQSLIVCLARLNRVRALDTANNTLTVEAGCTLQQVQEAACAADRLFPLSLASEGTCQIGGNLSTNAGGVQVLRYGNMRELTLGLEVVLPNGEVWNGLRGLRKDNTGYDLKQLFIGAEGTLGIITAAVLKLFPRPGEQATCWLALPDIDAAVSLLASAQDAFDAALTAFELITPVALELVLRHIPGQQAPLPPAPCFVLCEFGAPPHCSLGDRVESWLQSVLESGLILDAALAQSQQQAQRLWHLRESISEAQKIEGLSIKHDVSLPVSRIPAFIERAGSQLQELLPGIRIVSFGHLGDGNLHYNLSHPVADENSLFIARQAEINRLVHDLVHALDGSISAEHGLGQLKREEIQRYKSTIELDLMRSLKHALDPKQLMNPGKLV